ncbi:PHB depolymerase family esterase [Paraburkholderia sp. Ac-20340]|uniref:extracellular catalytic domain type 1 short-chain-length polyhydroxyalkanoate depolymerase n=1 Tax=Paraburkholderia sp. Ac-20340 TaxID=2703888 RepID=UPI00197F6F0B|nr:PHB depolymerase family esterase [Paraburkholderia sp. Ac-20340]MBN3856898.1 PHB depolymerase family esterase [Paraburkholderia sp. Ac-20340]
MPRKKSSVWLRGLDLLASVMRAPPKKKATRRKTAAIKTVASATVKRAKRAAPISATPRKGTRATPATPAKSAQKTLPGRWLRTFYSASPTAGRLVNHLAYALYLPASQPASADLPLVVMLHGCKQTAESFARGTRICQRAERAGFAVLLPEQAKTAHAQGCWHWHDDPAQTEAPAVAALIESLVREYGFDAQRVYLAGISAGAGLAATLAIADPRLFAAVGLHSGPVFGAATSTMTAMSVMRRGTREDPVQLIDARVDVNAYPGMPTIIMHGDIDAVVAKRNAEQLTREFARLNRLIDAQGELRVGEQRSYHRDGADYTDYVKGGRNIVRLCVVHGLGHAWSGGDPREPFHSARGPDATGLLWNFFRRQRRIV